MFLSKCNIPILRTNHPRLRSNWRGGTQNKSRGKKKRKGRITTPTLLQHFIRKELCERNLSDLKELKRVGETHFANQWDTVPFPPEPPSRWSRLGTLLCLALKTSEIREIAAISIVSHGPKNPGSLTFHESYCLFNKDPGSNHSGL